MIELNKEDKQFLKMINDNEILTRTTALSVFNANAIKRCVRRLRKYDLIKIKKDIFSFDTRKTVYILTNEGYHVMRRLYNDQ